jgi:hypothetical protein
LRTPLKPPDDLSPEAKAVFLDVVVNSKPEHFQASDVPLLFVYAEAVVQARDCAKQVREGQATDTVIKAQRNALSAIFQLSMRLRVSPQARQVRKSIGSNTRPPSVSYYDRLSNWRWAAMKRLARWTLGRDRHGRCRTRSPLPAAHLDAGGRPGLGLHADCALA